MPDHVDRLDVLRHCRMAVSARTGDPFKIVTTDWEADALRTAGWLVVEYGPVSDDDRGAVEAERARIITKIRHVAAGHLSPDDPWGAALRQIADILETERGQ